MKNAIEYMVKNKVAANILMISFILIGLISMFSIKKEIFPTIEFNNIKISIQYDGASTYDIENNIIIPIENEIKNLKNINKISSLINEGSATITVETDDKTLKDEIESKINGLKTLPEDIDNIDVEIPQRTVPVITLIAYSNLSYDVFFDNVNQLKNNLESLDSISTVEITGERDRKILIQLNHELLKKYNLSISDISNTISNDSNDLSIGTIKQNKENISLSIRNKKIKKEDFENIIIINNQNYIRLKDVANINYFFDDNDVIVKYNDKNSLKMIVYTNEDNSPVTASKDVKEKIKTFDQEFVKIDIQDDRSEMYSERMNLLIKNGVFGLFLILIILGLLLEFKLAFWISSGIAVSFLGSFIFISHFGVSINMMSMFAFILALGIVVDDAIIAGENIHEYRQKGYSNYEASIKGISSILQPLTFAILTNIVAFSPLLFVSGIMGKIFFVIPIVIGIIFIISWIDAVFILPNHLSKEKKDKSKIGNFLHKIENSVSSKFDWFIENKYKSFLIKVLENKFYVIVLFILILIFSFMYVKSGRLGFSMFPNMDSDYVVLNVDLEDGTLIEKSKKIESEIIKSLLISNKENFKAYDSITQETSIIVTAYLKEDSNISVQDFSKNWRNNINLDKSDIKSIIIKTDVGTPGGGRSDIALEIISENDSNLENAIPYVEDLFKSFGITDINNSLYGNKKEYSFELNEKGNLLNLNLLDITKELKNFISGKEIQTHFINGKEYSVNLEIDKKDSINLDTLEIKINGEYQKINQFINYKEYDVPSTIEREDGYKKIKIEGNLLNKSLKTSINNALKDEFENIKEKYNVEVNFSGREADRQKSMGELILYFCAVLLVIFILLAIPLESYIQPLIIMISIPFAMIGAFWGHYILGYDLSIVSIMGIVALSGVVINDSLVLLDYYNGEIKNNIDKYNAILNSCVRRFKPIFITTITTFLGVMPMIFETSMQAKILIPMAISLGFGILFSTTISLIFLPSLLYIRGNNEKI